MKRFAVILILIILLSTTLSVASASPPTILGGLGLAEYCQAKGYLTVTLLKGPFGPNYAFNNWRCVSSDGAFHPFSMEQACKWQYGQNEVQTHPTDHDNAYTWVCYSVANQ